MRIGIDLRPLGGQSGRRGVGSYLRGLLGGLLEVAGSEEIVVFHQAGSPPPGMEAARAPSMSLFPLTRPRRAATIWDQIAWPATLSRARVDVFHSPFWTIPVWSARRLPVVQTIHDLTPLKMRGSVSLKNEMIFRANFACARMARRVIVPSRATMDDAVELAGIRPDRIREVPEAVEVPAELLERAEAALPALRRSLRLEGRYVLHTGGQDIVKNIEGAVRAVSILVGRGADLKLVVTGDPGAATPAVLRAASGGNLGGRVVLSGFVEEDHLFALYRGAAALVYPSRNEGFGLPVLEAMACGTPVVAALAGALPEVGGEACLYADPGSPGELAEALGSILSDDALARRLSEAGRRRAARFTWQETARRTLGVYREAVGS